MREALNLAQNSVKDITEGLKTEKIEAKVGYRLAVGMGYPSAVENGFLFHHTYGIPYISGESVKGLVRAVFLYENFGEEEKIKDKVEGLEEEKYKGNFQEEYKLLFGTKKREGKVIYFDAYPIELRKENFVIDVMNPHYPDYYRNSGKSGFKEWENPIPVFFLALEGVEFKFIIASEDENLLSKAKEYLKKGLEVFGLGAKRRKGYGWFEEIVSGT
ncbi:type III-B CRISPR module RAMP protein Cmr6 [Aquifex sp.]